MGSLTDGSHKTLLPIGDRPILDWMLQSLTANELTDVTFVCGYNQHLLRDHVAKEHPSIRATWIENDVYDQTNTAYSLFLARETLLASGEDMLLLNGDVVLDHRAISATLEAKGANALATQFDRVGAEEVKVRMQDERIAEIGKHLTPQEAAGESVGINRISAESLPELFNTIDRRIREGEGRREFYEHAFNDMIQRGADFRTADVTSLPVMEVDTPEDYETVREEIAPRLEG